ncbi:MAG: AMP-binding protein [Gammaproteobacteria bacterium]|jgi:long-chain acyl-CoA synthetase|nr:AMP-binding protein [Gammaproteobacteria bacterium]MBU2181072.1 AMP-binding protein [Gammaproteobacteria bacterium]MBU2225802.1 AMP-binding protein [Gammaproteobacteria bacterium]MBU2428737.1 AMP-binding protein [Gammaproteobacteria bacterium]
MITEINIDAIPQRRRHFARQLEQFGNTTALVLNDGQNISYQTLAKLADHFAQNFVRFDVWPHQICALQCRNNLTSVVAYLSCLRHQRPLLMLDPALPAAQLEQLVKRLEIAALISEQGEMTRVSNSAFRARTDLALLLSTSGSTGSPKSVMLSQVNLQTNALAISEYLPMLATDTAITSLPLNYSYGLSVLNSHLLLGAKIVLTDYSVMNKEFWQLVNLHQVSSLAGVPFSYQMLKTLRFERLPLPALRYLTQAGGKLSLELTSYVKQLSEQRQCPVYLMYGQTEATARIAYLEPDLLEHYADCIGTAIPRGELLLRDPQDQSLIVEAYKTGELCYRGNNVMLGYATNSSELRTTTQLDELRTGDLAERLSNGLYRIVGRLNRVIKLQGKRWTLDAVEALFTTLGIKAICTGRDDLLIVAVIDQNPASESPTKASHYLQQQLNLHPSLFKVVLLRDIPYTSNGKVNYQAISTMAGGGTTDATG